MRYSTQLIAILALGLAGCNAGAPEDAGETSGAEEELNMSIDPRLETFVSQARSDLARRIEIEAAEITVIDAGFVTWPSSALGCPESDMMYTQALVPGYRIRLRADGALHHYHGADDKPPFYCPAERVTDPAAGTKNPNDVH